MACKPKRRRFRRGATVLEVALVLPLFLLFLFALFEIGHAVLISNLMNSACRTAARFGSTEGVTTQQAVDKALQHIGSSVDTANVTIMVKDAGGYDSGGSLPTTEEEYAAMNNIELADAEERQMYLVRAVVNYNDVAILSLPFMNDVKLTAQVYMRHE